MKTPREISVYLPYNRSRVARCAPPHPLLLPTAQPASPHIAPARPPCPYLLCMNKNPNVCLQLRLLRPDRKDVFGKKLSNVGHAIGTNNLDRDTMFCR
ncbi:hypothetical protein WH47_12300 [Habropoda laboriosa]|uniref:Uncharacterized protein n=1 Tax=Habropoda laboriosa TaxID=597456 RepID=A0A0L7RAW8_9HYME|nr:hypothetical protein WH47_12300 [Habropoda laboriosa]